MIAVIFKPYQSRLIPHIDEIIALRRRKPPMSYSRIAELMREKYQLSIRRESIFRFLQTRSKGFKTCKYAWDIELTNSEAESQPTPTSTPSMVKPMTPPPSPTPTRAVTNPPVAPASTSKPKPYFDFPFSETYNLHRLPPEEAKARLKKLEEKEKR